MLSTNTVTFANEYVNTTSAPFILTITSTGTGNLTVTADSVSPLPFSDSETGSCGTPPFTLTPGNSCTYLLQFAPLVPGAFSGTFSVTDNASGSPHTATISGTGVPVQVITGKGSLSGVGSILVHP